MKTSFETKEIKINIVTIADAKKLSQSEYNPSNWGKTIDSYNKYGNPIFYTVPGDIYKEDLFVIYTLLSGIRFRQKVSHSSMLSNSGFMQCSIIEDTITEIHLKVEDEVYYHKNNSRNRVVLANICKSNPYVFFS